MNVVFNEIWDQMDRQNVVIATLMRINKHH
jgi:hypothetical protein